MYVFIMFSFVTNPNEYMKKICKSMTERFSFKHVVDVSLYSGS